MNDDLKQIEIFFEERKDLINISGIERKAKLPKGTIKNFLNRYQYRSLKKEQLNKLMPVIVELGYKPVDVDNQFL